MPQLPEDIIDRLTAMERRIQQLSTAVNTRPALNRVSKGGVEISDGGYLTVWPPEGGPAVFAVGAWSGEEYGLAVRRQTGSMAMSLHNGDGTATSQQPLRIWDRNGKEIFADDVDTGGLARPWLSMTMPTDTALERWPRTTSGDWSTVARSWNPLWQPRMRMYISTSVTSGATGEVRIMINDTQWGGTVTAPGALDYTGFVVSNFNASFGNLLKFEIQARVTSASGTVYAQPRMMYGLQTT
ncbi:hypothetical protein ACFYWX_27495 [Streptomyces sp. NPDC002888]|uniref:hypothetical protein n=1 Tax=Streptomyces sp. NPDC002888 TaxID=3364668 RepID=UPI00369A57C1